jgi:hypothetical protein
VTAIAGADGCAGAPKLRICSRLLELSLQNFSFDTLRI